MEPIKLTGLQIMDNKRMKQLKTRRVWIELTEAEAKLYSGSLAAWEDNEVIFDAVLTPREIQGNDNGYERSIEKPKEESIYQKFKKVCIEYSGEAYYNKVKAHLGVEHVKDLEKRYDPLLVYEVLNYQISWIKKRMGVATSYSGSRTGLELWNAYFISFNNPKT